MVMLLYQVGCLSIPMPNTLPGFAVSKRSSPEGTSDSTAPGLEHVVAKHRNQMLGSLNDCAFNPARFTSAHAHNMAQRIKSVMINVVNGYF